MSKSVKTQHFEAEIQSGDAVLGIFGLSGSATQVPHGEEGPCVLEVPLR